MGLTLGSTGMNAVDNGLNIKKDSLDDVVVAVAGNPNVGKSSVFNILTGLKQHTGNWPGKTVSNAQGSYVKNGKKFILVDIPGTYSLLASSREEEVARDFICFGNSDLTVVVCDATCLERNLILVLQTMEVCEKVILCVNLMDEARKKHINVDIDKLSSILNIPVVPVSAKKVENIDLLIDTIEKSSSAKPTSKNKIIKYNEEIEQKVSKLTERLEEISGYKYKLRWMDLKLIENDEKLIEEINDELLLDVTKDEVIAELLSDINEGIRDEIASAAVVEAEKISNKVVSFNNKKYAQMDRRIDKLLTDKKTGIPIMIILLGVVFWITITGANYPSELLSNLLFGIEEPIYNAVFSLTGSLTISEMLVYGCYRVLAWVVSVMLPPMAIFFPMFTLLEDLGYLPRVAFNLDGMFRKCGACGKQALTT